MADNWDEIAILLGYADEEEMLKDLYAKRLFSLHQIASKLGVGSTTIARRLSYYDIAKRKPGGFQNRAPARKKLHLLDQRLVFSKTIGWLADYLNVHRTTVWKYKNQRGIHEILRNQPDEGVEPVFDTLKAPLDFGPCE